MTGQQFLDFLCSKNGQIGMLDKNYQDTSYRAFMLDCLNLVLKDISTYQVGWHWRFLEKSATAPTVADQHTYDLPTDIDTHKIEALSDRTYDRKYIFVPYDRFSRMFPDPSVSTGSSIYWTLFANVIRLFPVPNTVWTMYIDYVKKITALTDSGSSNTDVPPKYDHIIIAGARAYAYGFDPDLGNEAQQIQIYKDGLDRMMSENKQVDSELCKTESHRDKFKNVVDGWDSILYPLEK